MATSRSLTAAGTMLQARTIRLPRSQPWSPSPGCPARLLREASRAARTGTHLAPPCGNYTKQRSIG
jgi:hypothetical protein